MVPAGYILSGQRRFTDRAHPPMVIAHSLTSELFDIEECEAPYPDFHSFNIWPATAAVLALGPCCKICGGWDTEAAEGL
jgi:hypothetical protein